MEGFFARDGMECRMHFANLPKVQKEFNTECTESAEATGKRGSAEQVFDGGTDDAGGGFRGGLVAIAANQDDGGAFRFAHQEAGSGGEVVGDGENRRSQRLSVTVLGAPQIEENGRA